MKSYLDTSAAAKLLRQEAESAAMMAFMDSDGLEPASTLLLDTELRRLAWKNHIPQEAVSNLLSGIELYALEDSDFRSAGLLPSENLRSLDALHIQGAITTNADNVITYDDRMAAACSLMGIPVIAPA